MPYIFPKRKLNDEDVLSPTDLNEDIAPAAELYSGRLDEHNFQQGLTAELRTDVVTAPDSSHSDPILSNSYNNVYYIQRFNDPGWGTSDNYTNPTGTANRWILKNVPAWQPIGIGSAKDGKLKIFTGNSKLWLVCCFQYIWHGFTEYGGHHYSYPPSWDGSVTNEWRWARYPCMVQFALRVDGQIVGGTQTGIDDYTRRVVRPWQMTQTRAGGPQVFPTVLAGVGRQPDLPGPGVDGEANCGAVAPECHNLRLGAWVHVSAGTHIIELVGRRLNVTPHRSRGDDASDADLEADQVTYEPSNRVAIHNRQLLAIDYPVLPPSLSSTAEVSPGAFAAEDTVSTTTLGTDRVDKVRDKFNAIQRGAVDRGALNYRHLQSKVAYAGIATASPGNTINYPTEGPSTFSTNYPGWANNALTNAPTANVVAWFGPLVSTKSEYLRTQPNRVLNNKSVIILLGNVEIHRLNKSYYVGGVLQAVAAANEFCALSIFSKIDPGSGTVTRQYPISEGVINRDTRIIPTTAPTNTVFGRLDPVAHDVPLLQVIRVGGTTNDSNGNSGMAQEALGQTFEEFFIAGSTMSPAVTLGPMPPTPSSGSSLDVDASWWHGSLVTMILEE